MKEIKELPISEYQKRFFLEWAIDPESTKYNFSLVYKIKGNLNKEALKKACEKFIQDNKIVHARYSEDGEKCFYGNYVIDDFYKEFLAESANEKEIYKQLRELLDRKFDLTKDVLQKFYLLEVNENLHYFILSVAHIISDGTSGIQTIKQISKSYNCIVNNVKSDTKLASFINVVKVEKEFLTNEFNKEAKGFWKEFIGDTSLNINLPYKNSTNINIGNKSKDLNFAFDEAKTNELKRLAKSYKVTPFILISAAYSIVLSKFSNQEEFLLSYPVNMRPKEFEDIIGCFVNNIPLKINLKNIKSVPDLLEDISKQRKDVRKYQGYSMTYIMNDQRENNTYIPSNYFNVSIAQTNLNTLGFELENLEVTPVDISWSCESISELVLLYDEYSSDKIKFRLTSPKDLFSEEFIYQFKEAFIRLINDVLDKQDLDIKSYSILSKAEYQTIVYAWNQTDKEYSKDKTIYQLFEEQVEQNPDNVALVFEDKQLTYKELNERSNQLARYIRKQYKEVTNQELKPDTLIPLCLERSMDMVIGILGVMKAGGAYVPMDPEYPEERFKHILTDTQAKLVITQSHLENKLHYIASDIGLIYMDP
uniref:condensation domain-containing protein n=1 Tax=Francisella sp. SYW-9 TaxID=2610888 RepID=UPI00123C9CE0